MGQRALLWQTEHIGKFLTSWFQLCLFIAVSFLLEQRQVDIAHICISNIFAVQAENVERRNEEIHLAELTATARNDEEVIAKLHKVSVLHTWHGAYSSRWTQRWQTFVTSESPPNTCMHIGHCGLKDGRRYLLHLKALAAGCCLS